MRIQTMFRRLLLLGIPIVLAGTTQAQIRPRPSAGSGNRLYNPYIMTFQPAWQLALPDRVKLIDIANLAKDRQPALILLTESRDRKDPRRTLQVTHWDGFRFATDYSGEFIGLPTDTLLCGRLRTPPVTPTVQDTANTTGKKGDTKTQAKNTAKKPDGKPKATPVLQQIVTTEGVYEGLGSTFTRVFNAPANVRLALDVEKSNGLLVVGSGDDAYMVEIGNADVHPLQANPPADGPGFVRSGIGTQEFTDSASGEIAPGVRFVQSYWNGRYHWYIGLLRGTPDPARDAPYATTGDKLIVYTPTFVNRDKPFWALRQSDFEESWRSEILPGHVLDVRVGDPKNEGKIGILVLTSENKDTERHVHFYAPVNIGTGNGLFNGR